ncbi:uncharacterized protein RJT21DRAFT_118903 [Scheffersomyces amazonensis]|uniref:uncharacterized protein n=1 Tax=Scheffersomyces amazonensis TaxID=1078765 RepID=UPI00315CB7AD
MDYLELPSEAGSRRFLISPPISPHAEWNDFEREEDAPNKKAIHSPSELSHLLWERLGGFDSSVVRKYQGDDEDNEQELYQEQENQPPLNEVIDSPTQYDLNQNPEVLFEDRDRDVPAIILDSVRNAASTDTTTDTSQNRNFKLPKTTMPPLF